jgi:hypothetical protein
MTPPPATPPPGMSPSATPVFARIAWRPALTVSMAVGLAIAIVAAAFAMAVYNEHLGQQERFRQAEVQLRILAGSMAAPLAFDDRSAAREYVGAQSSNPDVEAVAAYDMQGELAASYTRPGAPPPPARNVLGPPRADGARLILTSPVTEGQTTLGSVYLRSVLESPARRAMRYAGFALLIVMAALLVAVLGAANAREAQAYRRLRAEIREREKAEEALRQSQKMEAIGQADRRRGPRLQQPAAWSLSSGNLHLLEAHCRPGPARQRWIASARPPGGSTAAPSLAQLPAGLLAAAQPLEPAVVDIGQAAW